MLVRSVYKQNICMKHQVHIPYTHCRISRCINEHHISRPLLMSTADANAHTNNGRFPMREGQRIRTSGGCRLKV